MAAVGASSWPQGEAPANQGGPLVPQCNPLPKSQHGPARGPSPTNVPLALRQTCPGTLHGGTTATTAWRSPGPRGCSSPPGQGQRSPTSPGCSGRWVPVPVPAHASVTPLPLLSPCPPPGLTPSPLLRIAPSPALGPAPRGCPDGASRGASWGVAASGPGHSHRKTVAAADRWELLPWLPPAGPMWAEGAVRGTVPRHPPPFALCCRVFFNTAVGLNWAQQRFLALMWGSPCPRDTLAFWCAQGHLFSLLTRVCCPVPSRLLPVPP